jgi:hypothetical protein
MGTEVEMADPPEVFESALSLDNQQRAALAQRLLTAWRN